MAWLDPGQFRGREVQAQAFGRMWKFSRWGLDIWVRIRKFATEYLPNPIEVAEKNILRLVEEEFAIRESTTLTPKQKEIRLTANKRQQESLQKMSFEKATSYLAPNSPELLSFLNGPDGSACTVQCLLEEHQQGITIEEAHQIAQALQDQLGEILPQTVGQFAPGN